MYTGPSVFGPILWEGFGIEFGVFAGVEVVRQLDLGLAWCCRSGVYKRSSVTSIFCSIAEYFYLPLISLFTNTSLHPSISSILRPYPKQNEALFSPRSHSNHLRRNNPPFSLQRRPNLSPSPAPKVASSPPTPPRPSSPCNAYKETSNASFNSPSP